MIQDSSSSLHFGPTTISLLMTKLVVNLFKDQRSSGIGLWVCHAPVPSKCNLAFFCLHAAHLCEELKKKLITRVIDLVT